MSEPISLKDIRIMATSAKERLERAAGCLDRDIMIYLHWTAGHYGQYFADYHFNIDADGTINVTTDDLAEILEHTWNRNTGAIGIALAGCYDATPDDLGDEAPTDEQIDSMAALVAVLCDEFGIPIDESHVMTHAEVADDDGYGLFDDDPELRWDLSILHTGDDIGTGGDEIRQLAEKKLEEIRCAES